MEAREITLRFNKDRYWMRIIKIEKCEECPFVMPFYKTVGESYLICEERRALREKKPTDRRIKKGGKIPDWCCLAVWKEDGKGGSDGHR